MNIVKATKSKLYQLTANLGKKININLKYYLKNSFWIGLRQLTGIITSLVLSVIFTRLTTKQVFGQYQFFLAILSTLSIVSIPGLNTSIIQSTARGYDGSYKKAVKTRFLWSLIGIPILLIMGGYYYIYQEHILGTILMISSVFFPFLYAPTTWDAFFQGKERFDLSSKYAFAQSIINMIAMIIILFLFKGNLLAIIAGYLFFSTTFNILWFQKSLKYIKNNRKDENAIKYGWFLTKINILSIIAGNLDKILIGILLSPGDLAIYAIGTNFAKRFLNLAKSLLSVASPKITKTNTVNPKRYAQIFAISSVFAISLYFMFPFLIPMLFSTKYGNSIFLSQIVIIFLPFSVINLLYKNHFVLYLKNKKILLEESFIFPIVKILFMIPLLALFNVRGLAFLLGFQTILNMGILYFLNKKRGII